MKNLCTVSDINFLIKGIGLFESLLKTNNDFILHYLLIDDKAYQASLNIKHPQIKFYQINELLEKDENLLKLQKQNYKYFCWTLASYFSNFLLTKEKDSITYIDSDIYFYENIDCIFNEIADKDIGLFRHRMFDLKYNYSEGLFNVGVVYFKNSEFGRQALQWWSNCVLHQLYPELNTCGDQKYLDVFYIQHKDKIFIDGNIGHGAPWQWQIYDFSDFEANNNIIWNGQKQKLVFSHFSQFYIDFQKDYYIPSTMHHCYTPLVNYQNIKELKKIYDDYFEYLKEIKKKYNL